jgi:hypothetical protein
LCGLHSESRQPAPAVQGDGLQLVLAHLIGGDCASRCGMTSIRPYRCIDFGVSGIGNRSVPTTASFKRENIGDDICPLIGFEHDVGHGAVRRTERRRQCDCCHPGSGRHDLEGRGILVGRLRLSILHCMTLRAEAFGRSKATARMTDLLRFAVSCGDRKCDHRCQQNMLRIHVNTLQGRLGAGLDPHQNGNGRVSCVAPAASRTPDG